MNRLHGAPTPRPHEARETDDADLDALGPFDHPKGLGVLAGIGIRSVASRIAATSTL